MVLGLLIEPLVLKRAEREVLISWGLRSKGAQAHALSARIVLRAADGLANLAVAEELHVTPQPVSRWRSGFAKQRIAGCLTSPGQALRKLGGWEIERVLAHTLECRPMDSTHSSVHSVAEATGLSTTSIHRIWSAFQLQSHRSETFKLSA